MTYMPAGDLHMQIAKDEAGVFRWRQRYALADLQRLLMYDVFKAESHLRLGSLDLDSHLVKEWLRWRPNIAFRLEHMTIILCAAEEGQLHWT